MKSESKIPYIIAAGLTILSIVIMAFVIITMARPEVSSVSLIDTMSESHGWSYEIKSEDGNRQIEPQFLDEFTMDWGESVPYAVKMTRSMTETLQYAYLCLRPYEAGTEVFLDDKLLYSDYQTDERDDEGYLILDSSQRDSGQWDDIIGRQILFSLPNDYTGRQLTIITYFDEEAMSVSPAFPEISTDETQAAPIAVNSLYPVIGLTICAILTLILCGVLISGIKNKHPDYRVCALIIFFLFWFIGRACMTYMGTYSRLNESVLAVLQGLYVVPLVIYAALYLSGWRKYILLIAAGLEFFYDGGRQFLNWKSGEFIDTGVNGQTVALLLLLLLILAAIELFPYKEFVKKYASWQHTLLCVFVVVACMFFYSREWDGSFSVYLKNVFISMRVSNFKPLIQLVTSVSGIMLGLLLIEQMVKTNMEMQKTVGVLSEREHFAVESLKVQKQSEEKTRAFRHEMNHHMNTIYAFLQENQIERAEKYIAAVTDELEALPKGIYSSNLMINVIASTYLDRAKQEGIKVQHRIMVPETLAIADSDLCVLLNNMLENAVEACERMPKESDRYLRLTINFDKNFLFISCVNSSCNMSENYDPFSIPTSKEDKEKHGYGIAAMKKVAEKYNSILKIEALQGAFSVKTNLFLDRRSKIKVQ